MMPIGPLMIEHRLIEKMLKVVDSRLEGMAETGNIDVVFIDTVVDFIRTYADRCHHGKEEDILFRELSKKPLTDEHKTVLNELISEHVWARGTTKKVVSAKEEYVKGNAGSVKEIVRSMKELIKFYPAHIAKEDKHFFLPIMEYFTREEKDAMLEEFREFDGKLIHEKYQDIVKKAAEAGKQGMA